MVFAANVKVLIVSIQKFLLRESMKNNGDQNYHAFFKLHSLTTVLGKIYYSKFDRDQNSNFVHKTCWLSNTQTLAVDM